MALSLPQQATTLSSQVPRKMVFLHGENSIVVYGLVARLVLRGRLGRKP